MRVGGHEVRCVEQHAGGCGERLEGRWIHVPQDELPGALAAHDPLVAAGRRVRVSGSDRTTRIILDHIVSIVLRRGVVLSSTSRKCLCAAASLRRGVAHAHRKIRP